MIESHPELFLYLKLEDIYHNIPLRAPLRQSEGVSGGYGIKPATNHPASRRKRAR